MNAMVENRGVGARILRIFGAAPVEPERDDTVAASPAGQLDPARLARRALMEQISDFLLEYNLEFTAANFTAARDVFMGENPRMAHKLAAKRLAGEAIDQEWLDENLERPAGESNREDDVDRLFARLDGSISAFTNTTRSARNAAAEYGSELSQHVDRIHVADPTGQMISSLADLAKAMLERTRQVEDDMKRSEREADVLRRSLEKARRDADIDHLTGLPNRRAFEELLATHHRGAQEAIEPLSVAFCDIDHFKKVNDTHGHETGDRVIQAIAQLLSRITNENVHVARHGGEEFVMLFRGLTKQEAQFKLDLAREAMAERRFVNRSTDEKIGVITFSAGIADVFAYPSPRDALKAADLALYKAKEEGRNRIALA